MSLISGFDGAIAAAGLRAYANLVMSTGPVAWWPLDVNLVDRVGGRNGVLGAGSEIHAAALPKESGGSFDCAGANWISVAHSAVLKPAVGSVMAWCRPAALQSDFTSIIGSEASGLFLGDFNVVLYSDGSVEGYFQDASTTHSVRTHSVYHGAGQIVHVIVTFDSTGFALYLDGNQINTNINYTNGLSNNSRDWHFGHSQVNGLIFNGMIGEIALWDRVLTRNEIYLLAQTEPD